MSNLIVNRSMVKRTFASYTSKYNMKNEKIRLKVEHTYKVANICARIAKAEHLDSSEIDLAWLMGMLHDVGRFEQLRQFNTFSDANSIDHAECGADILFREGEIRDYISDSCEDELIEKVIRVHNKYCVPEEFDVRETVFANLLRDADKVDILRVNVETPREEIYNVTTEELLNAEVTPEVMDAFMEHHAIYRGLMKNAPDHVVGHIALAFELVYPESRMIVKEQGFLKQMIAFESKNEKTNAAMVRVREEIESCENF